jgi:hypothetical protein
VGISVRLWLNAKDILCGSDLEGLLYGLSDRLLYHPESQENFESEYHGSFDESIVDYYKTLLLPLLSTFTFYSCLILAMDTPALHRIAWVDEATPPQLDKNETTYAPLKKPDIDTSAFQKLVEFRVRTSLHAIQAHPSRVRSGLDRGVSCAEVSSLDVRSTRMCVRL